jgi:uncharacterized protein
MVRARQDNGQYSDIDLAVDSPKASSLERRKVGDIVGDADTLLKIDCVRYDALKLTSALKQNIDAEGVRLYDRTKT